MHASSTPPPCDRRRGIAGVEHAARFTNLAGIMSVAPAIGAPIVASARMQESAAAQEWPAESTAKHAVSPLVLLALAAAALVLGARWHRRRRTRRSR